MLSMASALASVAACTVAGGSGPVTSVAGEAGATHRPVSAAGLDGAAVIQPAGDAFPRGSSKDPGTGANTARDGNIAIREEFDAALEAGTADALELFIRRHPDHPLAAEARRRLTAVRQGTGATEY
ncbi:hypothetical protein Salmuc_02700 [Salipiger mucosus DSM 16094]|uniref:Lipoprotein n=1 Tax=Salipiger mucosus DSM 16094 TaxID=1123237 RepID=S9QV89_9RHOB|nr:hypothetical protein Salmuc_02700 [Salipiger mucosus DSM 16094]